MGLRTACSFLLTILLLSFFASFGASAERRTAVDVVDIDRPIEILIAFTEGDRLTLSAEVHAQDAPISVFLIKGVSSYSDWLRSEDVELDEIRKGNSSAGFNVTFQVISNFSRMNVTDFDGSIEIGERDRYYLVIALHRDAGIPAKDMLMRAAVVDYDVEWSIEEKEVPLWLIPIAVLFFIAGTVAVIYSLWRRVDVVPDQDKGIRVIGKKRPPLRSSPSFGRRDQGGPPSTRR